MDSFDDLLAPSRHALEDNPFADPFARQRSSPDPWATPFAATDPHSFDHTSSQHFNSLDSFSNNEFGASSSEYKPFDGDPISSPVHTADDDDNERLGRMRSPGFRESIAASFSETATIRPATIEDGPSLASTTSTTQTDPDNLSPLTHSASITDTQKAPSLLGPPPTTESNFLSPLENIPTGLERSIIGLSLGGETHGWQTENQTPWQSEHPTSIPTKIAQSDEDSDDDKPIMQTLKHHDQDGSAIVSVYTVPSIFTHLFLGRHLSLRKQFEMRKEYNLYS